MTLHVAVVSGSRADFGPLQPLLTGLRDDDRFRVSTVLCAVAGVEQARLQEAAFSEAGLPIDVAVAPATDSGGSSRPLSVTDQASKALAGIAEALEQTRPDLVLLLGDRFEIMAAGLAAHLLRIPIVHLSGGDQTLGSLDDAMRHALSKLASLHLPTNEESARRLVALGAATDRIFNVGSTALDELVRFAPMTREELSASIGTDLGMRIVAVTYNPATQAHEPPADTVRALLAAVRDAAPDATIVVTGSNADEGGAAIDDAAHAFAASDRDVIVVHSLGKVRYWSLLHHADALVGNSSSALIEAPVIGVAVVDVGDRQASRLRADSCIHVPAERSAIAAGVATALSRPRRPEPSPYGDGRSVSRILDLLAQITDPAALLVPRPLAPVER